MLRGKNVAVFMVLRKVGGKDKYLSNNHANKLKFSSVVTAMRQRCIHKLREIDRVKLLRNVSPE